MWTPTWTLCGWDSNVKLSGLDILEEISCTWPAKRPRRPRAELALGKKTLSRLTSWHQVWAHNPVMVWWYSKSRDGSLDYFLHVPVPYFMIYHLRYVHLGVNPCFLLANWAHSPWFRSRKLLYSLNCFVDLMKRYALAAKGSFCYLDLSRLSGLYLQRAPLTPKCAQSLAPPASPTGFTCITLLKDQPDAAQCSLLDMIVESP